MNDSNNNMYILLYVKSWFCSLAPPVLLLSVMSAENTHMHIYYDTCETRMGRMFHYCIIPGHTLEHDINTSTSFIIVILSYIL